MKPAEQKYANSDVPSGDAEVRRLLACVQLLVEGQSAISRSWPVAGQGLPYESMSRVKQKEPGGKLAKPLLSRADRSGIQAADTLSH